METCQKLEIYPGREKYCQQSEEKLRKSDISQKNKELIEQYNLFNISTGKRGDLRRAKLVLELRKIAEWIKELGLKDLDELDKNDAVKLVAHINGRKLKVRTKTDYRKVLKQFYAWFKEEDPRHYSEDRIVQESLRRFYHFIEKEVSADFKVTQANPETIITDDDCQKVLEKGCYMPKELAFISLLHETGCRAGEFLNLKISDLKLRQNVLEIHVPDGKTGRRVIFANRAIPYVLRYLDSHPLKGNKNAYLWVSESSRHSKQPLLHIGGQRLIDRCFRRAGVNKKHNWHWFRHSRATILAPKMTEAILCKYMGWILGSRQVKTYCHLCNDQLEDVFLEINGIETKKQESEKPIKCICGTLNSPRERYCYKCYKPLSVEIAIQDSTQEVQEMKLLTSEAIKTMQFFMEMAKDPEMMKKFEEFKRSLKTE